MIIYSEKHEQYYYRMAKEVRQYGGYDASTNESLDLIVSQNGCHRQGACMWMDDLYDHYGNKRVME